MMERLMIAVILASGLILAACAAEKSPEPTAPAEQEDVMDPLAICEALAERMFSDEHPGAREAPAGLEGEELEQWLAELQTEAEAYEAAANQAVADEFGVTGAEVQAAYAEHITASGACE